MCIIQFLVCLIIWICYCIFYAPEGHFLLTLSDTVFRIWTNSNKKRSGMREHKSGPQPGPEASQCRMKWRLYPFEECDTRPILLLLDSPKSGTSYAPYAFKGLAGRMYLYRCTLVGMISMFCRAFPPHHTGIIHIYNEITLWLLIAVASLKWQAIIAFFDIGQRILEV